VTRRILFVDDEPRILQALERHLRERFEMLTAPGPEQGLDLISREGPFAVVVSDYRMPGMDGIHFLAEVKQTSPDTIRLMLTGQADLTTAIAAVNEGSIFRFLTKPCPPQILSAALDAALEQHRLITSERELLEKTLSGSIKVLTEVLSLVNPGAFSRACLIRKYAAHIASSIKLREVWELELAAMLCHLGYITVPQLVLDKVAAREKLTPEEQSVYSSHHEAARRLLESIPRLEKVACIIRNQSSPPSGPPRLDAWLAAGDVVAVDTIILRTALEFDRLATAGKARHDAVAQMRRSDLFPARFLDALETAEIHSVQRRVSMLRVTELTAGMVTNQDICTNSGVLILPKGEDLTTPLIEKIRAYSKTYGIPQPLSVLVPQADEHLS